jgi:membrane associated rhomboid family serine protease
MLLPIGHEETTVRRMPWVTLTIISFCLLAFTLTAIAPSGEEDITAGERRAVEFFLDHPYLELDQRLKGYIYYSLRPQVGQEVSPPDDLDRLQREQLELDVLVEAFYTARDSTPYFRWGLVPTQQRPITWLTHMLMHAGFLHLFANLFILYLVGPPLEDAWGHLSYAVFYVVAGLVAAIFFVAGYPDIDEPLVGASGAIAGVMGAFAIRYWNTRITFFYWFFFLKIYTGTFAAPAWVMLGLWVLGQLAFASGLWAFMNITDMGNVAFEAHIAGFVFGVGVAFFVKKFSFEERFIDPSVEERQIVHEAKNVEAALDMARQGRVDEANALLERDLERNPRDADAASALWILARANGIEAQVARRMVPALVAAARAGDDGLAELCWGELLRAAPEIDIAPATAVRLGEIVLAAGLEADAEETLRWLEDRVDRSTPVGQLTRLARMADRLGFRAPYAELALARPDLPPEVADELRTARDRGNG